MSFKLGELEIDLDKWPLIPSFMEVEGKSEDDVLKALNLLKIKKENITTLGIDAIYKEKYDIIINTLPNLEFTEKEKKFIEQFTKGD